MTQVARKRPWGLYRRPNSNCSPIVQSIDVFTTQYSDLFWPRLLFHTFFFKSVQCGFFSSAECATHIPWVNGYININIYTQEPTQTIPARTLYYNVDAEKILICSHTSCTARTTVCACIVQPTCFKESLRLLCQMVWSSFEYTNFFSIILPNRWILILNVCTILFQKTVMWYWSILIYFHIRKY